jgi:hypothetical protein
MHIYKVLANPTHVTTWPFKATQALKGTEPRPLAREQKDEGRQKHAWRCRLDSVTAAVGYSSSAAKHSLFSYVIYNVNVYEHECKH